MQCSCIKFDFDFLNLEKIVCFVSSPISLLFLMVQRNPPHDVWYHFAPS